MNDTLPPPEWRSPANAGRADAPRAINSVARRSGPRAEEASLRARVDEARAVEDDRGLLSSSAHLARWLSSRDHDLDEAAELVISALGSADAAGDNDLRRELSSWLERLGEPGRAAAALRPLASMPDVDPSEAAHALVRAGVLKARAGAVQGAAAAFESARSIDPADPLPCELLGALGGWAVEAVPPAAASAAYVEAARRRVALGQDAEELEDLWRAVTVDVASEASARALAEALERRGRPDAAAEVARWCGADSLSRVSDAWSHRPGDLEAVERLLRLLGTRSDDGERMAETLSSLLSQPLPADWLTGQFAASLPALSRADAKRAQGIARRALDGLGVKSEPLRAALLEVAREAQDDELTVAILERWLSSGAVGADRRDALLRLVDLHEALGDEEAKARTLARMVREGLRPPELARQIDGPYGQSPTPDAVLWRLRARAEWLTTGNDAESAAFAWRDLGAGLWDLADDRMGAIAAWQRAASVDPSRGHATFALDLVTFAGAPFAFDYLGRLIESEPDRALASAIAAASAEMALSIGNARLAFDLAERGVSRCPGSGLALGVAERASTHPEDDAALSALYDFVGDHALGRFGRRAAHYRGARLFERRGQHRLALKHAADAFRAVPSAGQSLRLLGRAAIRADDAAQAVRAIEQVAEGEAHPAARAAWLLHAAGLCEDGEEGARRKLDVLLRAVLVAPSVQTVELLRDAARDWLTLCPEERDGVELRLARASRTSSQRAQGPDAARVAVAFAITFLDLFADSEAAFAMLERAFECDSSVSEFSRLIGRGSALSTASRCTERIASMLDAAETLRAQVGVLALHLLADIASSAGDGALRARVVVAAAGSDPEDDDAIVQAEEAIRLAPEHAGRLSSRVAPSRRAAALVAVAQRRMEQRDHAHAVPLFERALTLVQGAARADIERELLAALDAAGRESEVEARAQHDAVSDEKSPKTRAERWAEIAERRELRGERAGAVQALLEACKLDGWSLERWSALERVSEIADDDKTRVMALEQIALQVAEEGRVAVYKRLAHVHARRGDLEATDQTWRRVLAFDPDDEEADHALEAAIIARGRYEDLADHLARRAQRLRGQSVSREVLRAVRLRRAAILEQRLGRIEDACEELERLLAEWPDNTGAIRYLADLQERRGEHARAASLWRRAASAEPDAVERDDLDMRAADAAVAAGDPEAALRDVRRVLSRAPSDEKALALSARLSTTEVAVAAEPLEGGQTLPSSELEEGRASSEMHQASAITAAKKGDLGLALDQARLAVAAAGSRAAPRLLACAFEYRLRGAGTADDARRTIGELTRIGEPLGHHDDALRAFLLAEALDVVQGDGAGLHELEATRSLVGDHPLLAVGMAERLAARGQHGPAVDAYRVALVGPLFELRKPAAVAVAAADSGIRAGWAVAELEIDQRATPSSPSAPPDSTLRDLELLVRSAGTAGERANARLGLAGARLERGDVGGAEPLLWEALADGLSAAGDMLAPVLASLRERTRDLVRVRRQQAALEPGDVERLESLRAAALADEDHVYARAVDHVLRAFDPGAEPLPPPPLAGQPEQPGLFAVLVRPSMDAAGEAYAVLWEGAAQLFVREAASYGVSGVERIVPGPSSAVARLYEAAMRILDAPRIPLFAIRRSGEMPTAHVALLSPPSVVVAGDVRDDSAELRFALGRGMAAALPQNALRMGLGENEGQCLIEALRTAFGPSELRRRVEPRAARMAESFWQIMPPRGQRRLQEILATSSLDGYESLVERARQSERRVGLFLSGDFACAARAVLAEQRDGKAGLNEPLSLGGLRETCEGMPALADLLRLAVSPEYAEARWHAGSPLTPRSGRSSGRIRLF